MRHFGPFVNGKSAYFMSLNRGKESIALDLKQEVDRRILGRPANIHTPHQG
jgi:CoA:oxalate CoA-transferase